MTNLRPDAASPKQRQVYELADALLCDAITAEDARRLGDLVCNDPEARRHYVRFMYGSAMLRQWGADSPGDFDDDHASDHRASGDRASDAHASDHRASGDRASGVRVAAGLAPRVEESPIAPEIPPTSIFIDTSAEPSLPRRRYFFLPFDATPGELVLGCGSALAFLGLLLFVLSLIKSPSDSPQQQIAVQQQMPVDVLSREIKAPADAQSPRETKTPRVARIAATFDCRWKFSDRSPADADHITLGQRFDLISGFAEIIYDSGTRVLLEGPCSYEIDSDHGGFLGLGKLTALVVSGEWLVASDGQNSSASTNHYPLTTNHFAVRTPTAIVTDLGTEFAVEVRSDGDTESHVFLGEVELRSPENKNAGSPIRLKANQSARAERSQKGSVAIRRVERGATGSANVLPGGTAGSSSSVAGGTGSASALPSPSGRGLNGAVVAPDGFTGDPSRFVRVGELKKPSHVRTFTPSHPSAAFARWQAFSNELRQRDDLVAYYDFQPDEKALAEPVAHLRVVQSPNPQIPKSLNPSSNPQSLIPNPSLSAHGKILRNRAKTGPQYDGRIENAAWVAGRFPGKYALEFGRPGSGVRVNVPVELRQLTLAAWVRVDVILPPNMLGSLLMSDRWHQRPGQMLWGVLAEKIIFRLASAKQDIAAYVDVFNATTESGRLGRWCFFAVTHDFGTKKVCFYCNGGMGGAEAFGESDLTVADLGQATIGGGVNSLSGADYSLPGRMGEMMIFRATLSSEEIRRVYQGALPAGSGEKTN